MGIPGVDESAICASGLGCSGLRRWSGGLWLVLLISCGRSTTHADSGPAGAAAAGGDGTAASSGRGGNAGASAGPGGSASAGGGSAGTTDVGNVGGTQGDAAGAGNDAEAGGDAGGLGGTAGVGAAGTGAGTSGSAGAAGAATLEARCTATCDKMDGFRFPQALCEDAFAAEEDAYFCEAPFNMADTCLGNCVAVIEASPTPECEIAWEPLLTCIAGSDGYVVLVSSLAVPGSQLGGAWYFGTCRGAVDQVGEACWGASLAGL